MNDVKRIGLATAVVAMSTLSACSMWHGATDRVTGRSTPSDTARTTRTPSPLGAPGTAGADGTSGTSAPYVTSGTAATAAAMPGADISRMRGPTVPTTSSRGMPTFRSYNECRTWLSQQGRALNRGPAIGGEVSMADTDPCRDVPRS